MTPSISDILRLWGIENNHAELQKLSKLVGGGEHLAAYDEYELYYEKGKYARTKAIVDGALQILHRRFQDSGSAGDSMLEAMHDRKHKVLYAVRVVELCRSEGLLTGHPPTRDLVRGALKLGQLLHNDLYRYVGGKSCGRLFEAVLETMDRREKIKSVMESHAQLGGSNTNREEVAATTHNQSTVLNGLDAEAGGEASAYAQAWNQHVQHPVPESLSWNLEGEQHRESSANQDGHSAIATSLTTQMAADEQGRQAALESEYEERPQRANSVASVTISDVPQNITSEFDITLYIEESKMYEEGDKYQL